MSTEADGECPADESEIDRTRAADHRQATGVPAERAAELLEASGHSVRTAIVMQKKTSRSEAEHLLDARGREDSGGFGFIWTSL